MPTPRCVLFDFGNVVAFFDHGKACRQLAQLSRAAIDPAAVQAAIFDGQLEEDYDTGRLPTGEFLQRLRRELDLDASDADIGRAWSDIFTPNDPVASMMPELKRRGLRLVLGSNTNELHDQWFSRIFAEPLSAFDAKVVSYRVGCRKPDPRFFDACLAATQVPASECLYIDDRAEFVAVGRECGMQGLVYTPATELRVI
jgi:glucose-1-phosphatase